MKDRELAAWCLDVVLLVVAAVALFLAFAKPKPHVTISGPEKLTVIHERLTLTNVLKFLVVQPLAGMADQQTPWGLANCATFGPLIDGRTIIGDCTLYTPVAPGVGPKS